MPPWPTAALGEAYTTAPSIRDSQTVVWPTPVEVIGCCDAGLLCIHLEQAQGDRELISSRQERPPYPLLDCTEPITDGSIVE